jgi:hypothetical protein
VIDATKPIVAASPPSGVRLGYRVRAVRTTKHLEMACALRSQAFARRQPELARELNAPELADLQEGSLVVLAVRDFDNAIVGTVRMQTNIDFPLEYETHIRLPEEFSGRLLGLGARLAVTAGGHSPLVTQLLIKAMYSFCSAQQLSRVLITAEPPRDRLYRTFGFEEVFPGKLFRTASTPHYACKLLYFDLERTNERLRKVNEPYLRFLQTYTPDIEIFASSLKGTWLRPRGAFEQPEISGALAATALQLPRSEAFRDR